MGDAGASDCFISSSMVSTIFRNDDFLTITEGQGAGLIKSKVLYILGSQGFARFDEERTLLYTEDCGDPSSAQSIALLAELQAGAFPISCHLQRIFFPSSQM